MLDAVVRGLAPGTSWNRARALVRGGKVSVDGVVVTQITQRVAELARVEVNRAAPRPARASLSDTDVVYLDDDVVVVDKPPGVLTVPYEGERDTLVDRARRALDRKPGVRRGELGVVQRLDKDTSGLLVFTRTLEAKRALQHDLRQHAIERRYLAIVHGVLTKPRVIETWLVPDRGDGLKGSHGHFRRARGGPPEGAQRALTRVRPLEVLAGATLVECELDTGRQHQIRIHLSEAGHPVCGETVYMRDHRGPRIAAPRQMLHAAELAFAHPRTGREMRFEREPPADFAAVLDRLRAPFRPERLRRA
jgi:23S rRNA pseudouridine1911/1915/1917 synthase